MLGFTGVLRPQKVKQANEETMWTVVVETESLVSTRPLTVIALDDLTPEALTLNHFLLMNANSVVLPPKKLATPKEEARTKKEVLADD